METIVYEMLVGKKFSNVYQVGDKELIFVEESGKTYKFYHYQDCCESVYIDSVVGDLNDLVGEPLLIAEETSSHAYDEEEYESCTWTFYKFATRKGYVDVRWVGSSNGYYSESVDFEEVE